MKKLPKGLSEEEAEKRLKLFGLNEVKVKQPNPLTMLLKRFVSPTSLMIELALILSFIAGRVIDAYVITSLLLINVIISFIHEFKAEKVLEELEENLRIFVKVIRDGKIKKLDSRFLVPGDVILLEAGDVVPADSEVLEAEGLKVDESMLTGESYPKEKKKHDMLYASSIIKSGKVMCRVVSTGLATKFGKTIELIEKSTKTSLIEQDVIKIAKFLMVTGAITIAVLSSYLYFAGKPLIDVLDLDISAAISSFPVALPTVVTLVTSMGIYQLSKKSAIVRRISSLENLSFVNLLLTDKTGTLTINQLKVAKLIPVNKNFDEKKLLLYSFLASDPKSDDPIDQAVTERFEKSGMNISGFEVIKHYPATSETKFAYSEVRFTKRKLLVVKGQPQRVLKMCSKAPKDAIKILQSYESKGFRMLAVASGKSLNKLELHGFVAFIDPPRKDAKEAVDFLKSHGVNVKMVTGDSRYVAKTIGKLVGIGSKVIARDKIKAFTSKLLKKFDIFAEVLPEDKHMLVKVAKQENVVAVTGDGVNDIPAIKEAHVGIAVANATNATKNSADLVLLTNGISVIKDAIAESKRIFERLSYYTIYRISESFRVIITILILGIILADYPLDPLQLIVLSLLNDIPIIAIAFDKVRIPRKPAKLKFKTRLLVGTTLGVVGVVSSLLFLLIGWHFGLTQDQLKTAFFLKLSVSGHLLLLVARTKKPWFKDLPSKALLSTILVTQLVASALSWLGIFMPSLSLEIIALTWLYAIAWMQVSELTKKLLLRMVWK